jgi:hypothetical protein
LFKLLEGNNMMLAAAACNSLGIMGRYVPLPVSDTEKSGDHSVTKKEIVTKLITLLENNERKVGNQNILIHLCIFT